MPRLQRHRLRAGYYTARARQKDLSAALYEVRREGPIAALTEAMRVLVGRIFTGRNSDSEVTKRTDAFVYLI